MNKRQLEQKIYGLVEAAKRGANVEDSTIELKSEWPKTPREAARQLAGHANAANGEPILWLIGIDEDQRKITGATALELADWLSAVARHFDQNFSPTLLLNVPVHVDGVVVQGLYFETDRAPYVTKNPSFGQPNGGPVQLEVPWREGNSTRSATRADLLRLLTRSIKRPQIEIRKAVMTFTAHTDGQEKWSLRGDFYMISQSPGTVVFPSHKWHGEFLHRYSSNVLDLNIRPVTNAEGTVTLDEIRCQGPLGFALVGECTIPANTRSLPDEINATIVLGIAGDDTLSLTIPLRMANMVQHNRTFTWEQGHWERPRVTVGALR